MKLMQAVLDAGIVPLFVALLKKEQALEVVKEAVWALCNSTSGASKPQILYVMNCHGKITSPFFHRELVSAGVVPVLLSVLQRGKDSRRKAVREKLELVHKIILEGLDNILAGTRARVML
jgi:hypothetical protein